MGTYTTEGAELYKPAIGEVGWGDLVDTNFDRLAELAYNVTSFGAVPDSQGAADANRVAIDAALAAGGAFFPPDQTFYVKPASDGDRFILQFRSASQVWGLGPSSIVKVSDDAGNYGSVFGPTGVAEDQDLAVFSNFKIDSNPTGNVGVTVDVGVGGELHGFNAIRAHNSSQVLVKSMWFDPCTGTNTVTTAGTGTDMWIRDSFFRFVLGQTTNVSGEYDNSAIYLECDRHSVIGCTFVADLDQCARGCIESHGGRSVIMGNISDGFETICNIVSRDHSLGDFDVNNINVSHNVARNAALGVQLWPVTDLRNVTVSHNDIHIANIDRESVGRVMEFYQGISWVVGVSLQGVNSGITIDHNTIRYQQGTRSYGIENYTAGIAVLASGDINGLTIDHNIVVDAPTIGLVMSTGLFAAWFRGLHISANTFIDNGRDAATSIDAYRTAFLVSGQLQAVDFAHNIIVDTGASSLNGFYSHFVTPDDVATDVRWHDNIISTVSGDLLTENIAGPVEVDADPDTALQVVLPNARGGLGTFSNLLLRSDDITNAAWTKNTPIGAAATLTANTTAPPTGVGVAADSYVANQAITIANEATSLFQAVDTGSSVAERTFTFSIYAKGTGGSIGSTVWIRVENNPDSDNAGGASASSITLTSAWQRVSHTYTFKVTTTDTHVDVFLYTLAVPNGATLYLWGAQLTETDAAAIYVGTAGTAVATTTGLTLTTDKALVAGGLGVGNSAAASTPGTVVKKFQIFDESGVSLGYVPIYNAIT